MLFVAVGCDTGVRSAAPDLTRPEAIIGVYGGLELVNMFKE